MKMKLMLLMSEIAFWAADQFVAGRRLVYNGSVRTTCKKRGQFVLQFKIAQKL
jgi:hypothetical protein